MCVLCVCVFVCACVHVLILHSNFVCVLHVVACQMLPTIVHNDELDIMSITQPNCFWDSLFFPEAPFRQICLSLSFLFLQATDMNTTRLSLNCSDENVTPPSFMAVIETDDVVVCILCKVTRLLQFVYQ